MEETYTIRAIILNRQAFRENDSRLVAYSRERGKLTLVARGTGFIKSKLSGHIEPFSELDMMIARGRRFDYIAGVKNKNRFRHLQDNFEKISTAGASLAFVRSMLEENEADTGLYSLILGYLHALNDDFNSDFSYAFLAQVFIFKTYAQMGFYPELYFCTSCARKTKTGNNCFDFSAGGIICPSCASKEFIPISDNALKILRFIVKNNFKAILRLEAEKKELAEAMKSISFYAKFRAT